MRRIIILIFVSLTVSCTKSDTKFAFSSGNRLNIADGRALAISSEPSNARVGQVIPSTLFKIDSNGDYLAVRYMDENGIEIPYNQELADRLGDNYDQIIVKEIYYPHPDYLLLSGEIPVWSDIEQSEDIYFDRLILCLINKETGQLYDASEMLGDWLGDLGNGTAPFQNDNLNNIYFNAHNGSYELVKMDMSNPDELVLSNYLPPGQEISNTFWIDGNGNCVYLFNGLKVRKSEGGVELIQVEDGEFQVFWLGENDQIYATAVSNISAYIYSINESFEPELEFMTSVPNERQGLIESFHTTNTSDAVLFLNESSSWKFDYLSQNLTELDFSLTSGRIWETANSIYVVDQGKIQIISLTDFSLNVVEVPSSFEVYNVNIRENEIHFNGLRFSDGAIVDGQIDESGNVTIVKEDLETIITSVYPISN